jgi:hypothetical protein
MKAFLSHSSKNKDSYVRVVAQKLKKENISYDEFTFEDGEKTFDEILKGLERSELFVFFISNDSLESEWVKSELCEIKKIIDRGDSKIVYPIIIDNNIKYDDKRIPRWLVSEYNLRPISKPSVAARRIHQKLREIWYSKNSLSASISQVFVGRNSFLSDFEDRFYDFDQNKPVVIFVSGLNGVGRKTFIKKALEKTNVIKNQPELIYLDSDSYIEDFIFKINDLGFVDIDYDLKNLSNKTIQEKSKIVYAMISAIRDAGEVVFIIDNGCIINYRNEVSGWFLSLIDECEDSSCPVFCVISKKKVPFKNRPRINDKYYFINLPELSVDERKWLLKNIFDKSKLSISTEDFSSVVDVLSGLPDQARFAVNAIKESKTRIVDTIPIISEYVNDGAAIFLKDYESDEKTLDLIRMLAQFEVISQDFLFSIVSEEFYYNVVEKLVAESIIDQVGYDSSMLRLNDVIRSYIRRNKLNVKDEFKIKINEHVKNLLGSEDILLVDSSDYIFSLQESLKNGYKVDDGFLIPSHYIRSIKEIYYSKGNMDRVIELAYIVLQNENNMDNLAVKDVRYYLCLALAKKKDQRFLSEVQRIDGVEHDFLLGYYYRLTGRYREALERFNGILNALYIGSRVKREVVQVYVYLEEFDKALTYAKKNYEENSRNQFHIQAYFNCLINSHDSSSSYKAELRGLIDALLSIKSDQAMEMAGICAAVFEAKINENKVAAFDKINETIVSFPNTFYPLLTYCDLCIRYEDSAQLKDGIKKIENMDKTISPRTINKYKSYSLAFEGKESDALELIRDDISRYPAESKDRVISNIKQIAAKSASRVDHFASFFSI